MTHLLKDIISDKARKMLEQKELEMNVEILNKSNDVDIEELKAEFEDIKLQFRELVLSYLRSESTDEQTKDFLMNDSRIKNLMEGVPEYNVHLYKTNIINEGGKVYDETYQ